MFSVHRCWPCCRSRIPSLLLTVRIEKADADRARAARRGPSASAGTSSISPPVRLPAKEVRIFGLGAEWWRAGGGSSTS